MHDTEPPYEFIGFVFLTAFVCFVVELLFGGGSLPLVEVKSEEVGPLVFVYKRNVGPYHKVGSVFDEVSTMVQNLGISCDRLVGIYFDDPRRVDPIKLRSEIGVVVGTSLQNYTSLQDSVTKAGLEIKFLPKLRGCGASFSYCATFYVFVSGCQVYKSLKRALSGKWEKQPCIKMHSLAQKTVLFFVPYKHYRFLKPFDLCTVS
mmetsp:Transcript_12401/g.17236  ORF Transcript_12401/g.17236 Transcript_12401/m.17236 type:complete len:204 (+) Transcript_12401:51-662(+)